MPAAEGEPCWIVTLDRADIGHAWDALGRRISRARFADHLSDTKPLFHYGAAPGERGHELLSAAELGARLGCELVSTLVLVSPILLRELPLLLLAPEAVEPLPACVDAAAVRAQLRARRTHPALCVRSVGGAGHGLFALEPIAPHALLGEYVGLLCAAGSLAARGASDPFVCTYPAFELCVTASAVGGLMRTINHAPGARANVSMVPVLVDGAYHLAMLSRSEVGRGQQLLLDYGKGYWAARGVQPQQL